MLTCKNCIHFKACENWAHRFGLKDLCFPLVCEDNKLLCDQYNPTKLPPAYIGMKVWIPWVFRGINKNFSELREGHISGLQQKANGSWKIRCTSDGSVADYTIEDFNKYCFTDKAEAEKSLEKEIIKLENS